MEEVIQILKGLQCPRQLPGSAGRKTPLSQAGPPDGQAALLSTLTEAWVYTAL